MYNDLEVSNIIHAGLIFIVYLFIAILLYYFLSYPIDILFDGFKSSSVGTDAESYVIWMYPNIKWAVNVVFALAIALPIVWFITWIFSREADFGMYRR